MGKKSKTTRKLKKTIEEQQRKIDDLEMQLKLFQPPVTIPYPGQPGYPGTSIEPFIYQGDDNTSSDRYQRCIGSLN